MVHVKTAGRSVALVTLDAPDRRNAMTLDDWQEFSAILDRLAVDPAIRTLVLRGAGGTFCAGADLAFLRSLTEASLADRRAALGVGSDLVAKLIRYPVATLALVEGPAVAIGASLALACDTVVAAPQSTFGFPFTALGIPGGDMAASWLVARRVGTRTANRLFAAAQTVGAEEAISLGLIDMVSDATDIDETVRAADARADRVAATAEATTKRQLLEIEGAFGPLDIHMERQLDALSEAVGDTDFACALARSSLRDRVQFAPRRL